MRMLALAQVETTASWVGPTVAIALVVIALAFVVIGAGTLILALALRRQVGRLGDMVESYRDDLGRTISSGRGLIEQTRDLLVVVRDEAGAVAQTSRRLRRRVERGADRVQTKLEDLEALYDVVQGEVEESALDLAAAVRTVREGDGVVGRMRRALLSRSE